MKILAIQSELPHSNRFIQLLESEGFNVIIADNGLLGVSKAQSELPDLIISDIIMPELDGYGVLKALRENHLTAIIPLIFLINKPIQAEIRKAMEMGADDCLAKCCSEEEFLKAIAVRLERYTFVKQWYVQKLEE